MKKILPISILISLVLPVVVLGQTTVITAPELPFLETITKIGNLIFTFLLVLSVIFLIYAGILFVMAAGKPEDVEKARHIILYALIGIIVAFLAKGIVFFIRSYLAPGI